MVYTSRKASVCVLRGCDSLQEATPQMQCIGLENNEFILSAMLMRFHARILCRVEVKG